MEALRDCTLSTKMWSCVCDINLLEFSMVTFIIWFQDFSLLFHHSRTYWYHIGSLLTSVFFWLCYEIHFSKIYFYSKMLLTWLQHVRECV